ncbi:DNA-processing protein DprA [Polymorphospora sp. NPDC050346]|uniref:DNA-processing protein DprA n=1 Tax=Polymorphospora sp. NPDC050346 TaxID=3155780 RepID=UPI0033D42ED6
MPDLQDQRISRAVLARLTRPGDPRIHALVQEVGPRAALDQLLDDPLDTVFAPDVDPPAGTDARRVAAQVVADTERIGARIVTPEDGEWPASLVDLASGGAGHTALSAPLCLWVRAQRPLPDILDRAVAVVGARAATSYGQHIAAEIGHALAEQGWGVLSTGGHGIDAAALRAARAIGPAAAAMPACGLDRPSPTGNQKLFERVDLISAWPPGSIPKVADSAVNRAWVAALTRGTVLVEASLRSRAAGILSHALAVGRPAMAVPGPVTSALSAGCHRALRADSRVRLVRDAADVVAHLTALAGVEAAVWSPAWVVLSGVGGPYQALVADRLDTQGWPVARFDAATIARIAADCDALAVRVGEIAGVTRLRLTGRTVIQIDRSGTPTESVSTIAADVDGLYRLDGWRWDIGEPPPPGRGRG